jgi:signal transduction histidine kinase
MAEEALRENEIVEAQLADVRASRARILEAADRGRREIERNLHDGAPSSGSYRSRSSSSCGWPPHRDLPEDARARVAEGLDELRAGLAELRDLAHGLHPAVLTDHGLKAVLTLASRAAVPVELDIELNGERPPLAIESVAYFTVSEALTNVAKYAEASYGGSVRRGDGLHVEIGDDGVGGLDERRGSGVQGLRDRIGAVGGTLQISSRPNRGTVMRASLPIEPADR